MRLLALGIAVVLLAVATQVSFTGLFLDERVLVERVVDGDTIVLEDEERVRLLGIDTPERGQFLFEESTAFLRERVEGKRVRLVSDQTDRDKYDRLLRHVYIGDKHVNLLLVREGYASVLVIEPDIAHTSAFLQEEQMARERGLGIWAYDGDFCISLFSVHFNAQGNDNQNLNDEFITLRNKCTEGIDLSNWLLKESSGKEYRFPAFSLESKATVTLHTGSGEDNATDLFWGLGRAVWNNDGDSLEVWDSQGTRKLDYTYEGF